MRSRIHLAWVLVCGGCVSWAYGLAGCGILVKASLVSGRDLAAYLLSVVSIWRALSELDGVESVAFSADRQTVYIKALQKGFDQEAAEKIISGV